MGCAEEGVWTVMSEDGRGGMSDAVAMGADEAADQLDVEVHSGDGLVARGSVPVADLWTVRPLVPARFCATAPFSSRPAKVACKKRCSPPLSADAVTQQPYFLPSPVSNSRNNYLSRLGRHCLHPAVCCARGSCGPRGTIVSLVAWMAGYRWALLSAVHMPAKGFMWVAAKHFSANSLLACPLAGRREQRQPWAARPRRTRGSRHRRVGGRRAAALLRAHARGRRRGRRVRQEVGCGVRRHGRRAQARAA